jgi:hypothetical protein
MPKKLINLLASLEGQLYMTTRIKNINPVQLGIVYAALYAVIGLLIGIVVALFSILAGAMASSGMPNFGWLSIIIFPILYGVIGFIGGIIVGFFYNLVAGWTGGIELTFSSAPVASTSVVS